jgi:hypothetical protein
LRKAGATLAIVLSLAPAAAQKFYPDDPLWAEPPPLPVGKPRARDLSDAYDVMRQTMFTPGGRPGAAAGAINTLGEVPDSAWYQNRHSLTRRMSTEELIRGPNTSGPPEPGQPWTVLSGKSMGATPGLVIEDSRQRKYLLKFDPRENPSLTTAADVISSKFFYALGYNVPENYVVRFGVKQLRLAPDATIVDVDGKKRKMLPEDLIDLLKKTSIKNGMYRAMASLYIGGELIGPFQYFGTRSDDPNDIVPHENRRDLRGLYVFAAWLNHYDATSINTLDSVVEENGVRFIRHYLIDFGSTLGASALGPRALRSGNAYLFDLRFAASQLFTLGLDRRPWQVAKDPYFPELGEFGYTTFDPSRFKPIYPNPAFINRRPDDTYWAAKKVMAFTDKDIRDIVRTGEYDEPKALEWLVKTLIERRNRIGAVFLQDVLPLEGFRFQNGNLKFDDLAVQFGLHPPRSYEIQWFRFDNGAGLRADLPRSRGPELPAELAALPAVSYFGAQIRSDAPGKAVAVYFRTGPSGIEVVGIDRQY